MDIHFNSYFLVDDEGYFDCDIIPSLCFTVSPVNWDEDGEPMGKEYSLSLGWLVFGISVSFVKK